MGAGQLSTLGWTRTSDPEIRNVRGNDFATPEETTESTVSLCPSTTFENPSDFASTVSFTADGTEKGTDLRNPQIQIGVHPCASLSSQGSQLGRSAIGELGRLVACVRAAVGDLRPQDTRPRLGGISFLHRFGSALNHHVHLHACVTDGVFMPAAAADMLAWENSGFSVDASVRITLCRPQLRVYFQRLEHLLRLIAFITEPEPIAKRLPAGAGLRRTGGSQVGEGQDGFARVQQRLRPSRPPAARPPNGPSSSRPMTNGQSCKRRIDELPVIDIHSL